MNLLKVGQTLTGTIEALAFGGEGILRHNGFVLFVPFAAPGDAIDVEVTEVKKKFARAKILRLITAAKNRIAPKCPHFGICGGCQLQHLDYQTQLESKGRWVSEALLRIGKLADIQAKTTIAASTQWEYRRVVRLHFLAEGERFELGYIDADSRKLLPVKTCPIFHDDVESWKQLNFFFKTCVQDIVNKGFISLFKSRNQFVALLDIDVPATQELLTRSKELPSMLQGLTLMAQRQRHDFGNTDLELKEQGMTFAFTPLSFVQNHPEQSSKILETIISAAIASGAKRVFDLYCGFGVSAISLAKKGLDVTAVESNPESIALGQRNAKTNGVQVTFVCDDVAQFIEKALRDRQPELVIVNPPRVGLHPRVCNALSKSNARSIIYISCMPQTLARDLSILKLGGFHAEDCQPYDMFPQTTHVETVIVLRRLR